MFDEGNKEEGSRWCEEPTVKLLLSYVVYHTLDSLKPFAYGFLIDQLTGQGVKNLLSHSCACEKEKNHPWHFKKLASRESKFHQKDKSETYLVTTLQLLFCVHPFSGYAHLGKASALYFTSSESSGLPISNKLRMRINGIPLEEINIPLKDIDVPMAVGLDSILAFCEKEVFTCVASSGWDKVLDVKKALKVYQKGLH